MTHFLFTFFYVFILSSGDVIALKITTSVMPEYLPVVLSICIMPFHFIVCLFSLLDNVVDIHVDAVVVGVMVHVNTSSGAS